MVKRNYYIVQDGKLKRKQNTVYFVNEQIRKILPINKIYSIYAHGALTFTSGVISYLAKKGIPIHFFNYYGYYEGSFYPRESLVSGKVVVSQAEHYLSKEKRLVIAKEFIEAMSDNILKNLNYYSRQDKDMDSEINEIESVKGRIESCEDINHLLSIEGSIWNTYYHSFNEIFPKKFRFNKRTRRPPKNMVNCLISFGNSLLYSSVLTEIYNTQLNPTISFLHEPSDRRFSLSLDISEIFKPFLSDRVMFKLINKNMIDESHFVKELNYCLLNEKGKRLYLKNYDERLQTTIKHKKLGRNVSYQRLIRMECYKLIKHILEMEKYKAFRIWW